MKNATPSDIAIRNVINDIDELISYAKGFIKASHNDASEFLNEYVPLGKKFDSVLSGIEQIRTLGYINSAQFEKIKIHFYITDEDVFKSLEDVSTDYLNTNKGGHIADIIERIFPQTEENLFIERMNNLKESLNKALSKEEKTRSIVKGLKGNFLWEKITIMLKGIEVDVFQDNRKLGEYTLDDLGFPKAKGQSNVRGLFMGFFFDNKKTGILLFSEKNKNQALKKILSAVLRNAFSTNIDPIEIDENKVYKPKFKVKTGGMLRINEHRSGMSLNEEQEY
jgi:hypothetical protein